MHNGITNGTIPKGWVLTSLESLGYGENAIVDGPFGSNLKTSDYINDPINGIPVLTTKNLEGDYSDNNVRFISNEKFQEIKRSQVKGNDILIAKIGSIGKTGIYPLNARTAIIPANLIKFTLVKKVNFKYVYSFLNYQGFQNKIKEISTATAQPAFNVKKFRLLEIPLPPISEQNRIVSKLDELFSELDKGVEALNTAKQQLNIYRQAVLKWAYEGKLTDGWRKQNEKLPNEVHLKGIIESVKKKKAKRTYSFKEMPNNSFLPKIPDEWIWVKLNEVAEDIFDGPFGSNLKTNDYVDKGIRVVRLENIGRAEFKNEFKTYISEEKYKLLKKHTVGDEDIVFSSFINEEIRATILPKHLIKAINKADCFCVRVNKSVMNHFYLIYFLISTINYNQLKMQIHGATRPRINTGQLKDCLVPYCSKEEQIQTIREIEIRILAIDKVESAINTSLMQAEDLRQSILKNAFEGKLVPQKPNDEPASLLLERIKAERSSRDSEIKKKASYGR